MIALAWIGTWRRCIEHVRSPKRNLVRSDALPRIEVDPETFAVKVDGELATVLPTRSVAQTGLSSLAMVTVPARACLAIPAVLRRRCGLRAGDQVLLAAVPGQDMLAAYSFAVVDQALRAHGTFPHAPGGQP